MSLQVVKLISDSFNGLFDRSAQEFVVQCLLEDEHCTKFPPAKSYIAKLLKLAIRAAEDQRVELHDQLLDLYLNTLDCSQVWNIEL